jgi:hypothetical protein
VAQVDEMGMACCPLGERGAGPFFDEVRGAHSSSLLAFKRIDK